MQQTQESTENQMTFHFAVTIDIPDHGDENPIGPNASKMAYRMTETEINRVLSQRLRPLTQDTTWKVEPIRPDLQPAGLEAIPLELRDEGNSYVSGLTRQCSLQAQCYKPDGHRPPCAKWGGEVIITDAPGELEKPDQINIDARHSVFHEPMGTQRKYARCGNCGTRYEITDDPVENHHRAMRHKDECGKGNALYTEGQRRDLVDDFNSQPMQVAFRERAAAELEAGADPELLKLTGVSVFNPATGQRQGLLTATLIGHEAGEAIRQRFDTATKAARGKFVWWKPWTWFI